MPISQVWPGGNSKLPEEEELHDVSSLVKFPEAWYVSSRIDHKCSRVAEVLPGLPWWFSS